MMLYGSVNNFSHLIFTMFARLAAAVVVAQAFFLVGCGADDTTQKGPRYTTHADTGKSLPLRLAIHPLNNPKKLMLNYQPLINYLNTHVKGVSFELEASRDYQRYEDKFRARSPELLLPNPWQTLEAIKVGYEVIAMSGESDDFRGIFVVRKDSGIERVEDLRGKKVSYPSPTALAASIMPQYFLHSDVKDINRDIDSYYVGSQESSIMNVYLGLTSAGGTWPPPWRQFQRDYPQEAADLKVIWKTPPLMNNSVMVRNDLPKAISEQVQQVLLELGQSEEGRAILVNMETARFHIAKNEDYLPVREFVDKFEKEVRPVEQARE